MFASILSLLLWTGPPGSPSADPSAPERVDVVPAPSLEPESPELGPTPEPRWRATVEPPDLHVRWAVDVPLLVGGTALWLGTELGVARLVPTVPRWTEAPASDLALRRALIWRSPATARQLSDAFAFGVIPLFGLSLTLADVGATRQWRVLHEDLVIVLETVALSGALTQAIKLGVARGRPYTYEVYHDPADPNVDRLLVDQPDAKLSFPSGHANLAFAVAASFATVATMRQRKLAPYSWAFGMPLAAFVAYLRVAGHRHWFSDVVVGSTIGTVVGTGLPLLLHHPKWGLLGRTRTRQHNAEVRVLPSPSGISVVGRF